MSLKSRTRKAKRRKRMKQWIRNGHGMYQLFYGPNNRKGSPEAFEFKRRRDADKYWLHLLRSCGVKHMLDEEVLEEYAKRHPRMQGPVHPLVFAYWCGDLSDYWLRKYGIDPEEYNKGGG